MKVELLKAELLVCEAQGRPRSFLVGGGRLQRVAVVGDLEVVYLRVGRIQLKGDVVYVLLLDEIKVDRTLTVAVAVGVLLAPNSSWFLVAPFGVDAGDCV